MNSEASASPAVDTVKQVSDWCTQQSVRENRKATLQLWIALVTLLVGIVLLLFLPRIIDYVDYYEREAESPIQIRDMVENTRRLIGDHSTRLDRTRASRERSYEILVKQRDQANLTQVAATRALKMAVSRTPSIFKPLNGGTTSAEDARSIARTILELEDGALLLGGSEVGEHGKETILLTRVEPGQGTVTVFPRPEQRPISGQVRAATRTNNGQYFAVGFEDHLVTHFLRDSFTLLLQSTDSLSWTLIHPREEDSKRIPGELHTVIKTRDGTLMAAGFEYQGPPPGLDVAGRPPEALLLLRSTDGETWEPVRPMEGDRRIRGQLHHLVETTTGEFLAVGFEYPQDTSNVRLAERPAGSTLVLYSKDGESWTPVRPTDRGRRIRGQLLDLIQAKDGTFLAGGFEDSGERVVGPAREYFDFTQPRGSSLVLFLRSRNGRSWTPVRPTVSHKRIPGVCYAVVQDTVGKFFGVGITIDYDSLPRLLAPTFLPPQTPRPPINATRGGPLFLQSTNAVSWSIERLHLDGVDLAAWFHDARIARDGTIVFSGRNMSSIRSLSTKDATDVINDVVRTRQVPGQLVFTSNVAEWLKKQRQHVWTVDNLDAQAKSGKVALSTARRHVEDQAQVAHNFETLEQSLAEALRDADAVRQGGQVATRIAILGLVTYLVHIFVTNFRYHNRLAKFYQGRGHALQLLVDSRAGGGLLGNTSVAELATTLSPENIGFENHPRPPAPMFSAILKEGSGTRTTGGG